MSNSEMPKSQGGRPTALTESIISEAALLAASVDYAETLADMLGVHRTTLRRWIKRGCREQRRREQGLPPIEGEDRPFRFCIAIKKGRALAEKHSLEVIEAAANAGVWQAAAWRLERAHPERWSQHKQELARLRKLVNQVCAERRIDPETGQPSS